MAIGERGLKPINTTRRPGSENEEDEEEEEKPLIVRRRVNLFHTPKLNCFIVAVLGCKTTSNVELIKHGLTQTLIKHPRFSSKLALTIHFQSYVDKMMLVLAVDEDVIPDPYKLCDDIEESLKLAKDAIIT